MACTRGVHGTMRRGLDRSFEGVVVAAAGGDRRSRDVGVAREPPGQSTTGPREREFGLGQAPVARMEARPEHMTEVGDVAVERRPLGHVFRAREARERIVRLAAIVVDGGAHAEHLRQLAERIDALELRHRLAHAGERGVEPPARQVHEEPMHSWSQRRQRSAGGPCRGIREQLRGLAIGAGAAEGGGRDQRDHRRGDGRAGCVAVGQADRRLEALPHAGRSSARAARASQASLVVAGARIAVHRVPQRRLGVLQAPRSVRKPSLEQPQPGRGPNVGGQLLEPAPDRGRCGRHQRLAVAGDQRARAVSAGRPPASARSLRALGPRLPSPRRRRHAAATAVPPAGRERAAPTAVRARAGGRRAARRPRSARATGPRAGGPPPGSPRADPSARTSDGSSSGATLESITASRRRGSIGSSSSSARYASSAPARGGRIAERPLRAGRERDPERPSLGRRPDRLQLVTGRLAPRPAQHQLGAFLHAERKVGRAQLREPAGDAAASPSAAPAAGARETATRSRLQRRRDEVGDDLFGFRGPRQVLRIIDDDDQRFDQQPLQLALERLHREPRINGRGGDVEPLGERRPPRPAPPVESNRPGAPATGRDRGRSASTAARRRPSPPRRPPRRARSSCRTPRERSPPANRIPTHPRSGRRAADVGSRRRSHASKRRSRTARRDIEPHYPAACVRG